MDTIVRPLLSPDTPSRGREGYARLGVLWTKPGCVDAPRVLGMLCSDEVDDSTQEQVPMDCDCAFYARLGQSKHYSTFSSADDLNGVDNDPPQTHRAAHPTVYFTDLGGP